MTHTNGRCNNKKGTFGYNFTTYRVTILPNYYYSLDNVLHFGSDLYLFTLANFPEIPTFPFYTVNHEISKQKNQNIPG